MSKDNDCRSHCPVNYALEIIGDVWSLLIVRDIMIGDKSTYGEFLTSRERISTNILADRLSKLERNGIITKEPNATDKRKDLYRLTRKGADLYPVLLEMVLWSSKYDPQTRVPKDFVDCVKRNKRRFTKERMREYISERIGHQNTPSNTPFG